MTDFLESWANQSKENAKLVAQEALITEITEEIWKRMEERGINKAELAKRLDATKGFVSQVLSGSRNMTLRTLSDICFALECKTALRLENKSPDQEWCSAPQEAFTLGRTTPRYTLTGNVIRPADSWQNAA